MTESETVRETGTETRLAATFEEHRRRLASVAYRLLGSTADADDAVQETWLRLQRTDVSDVQNLGAWLTTVVARISLNTLRTRKARREDLRDTRLPDPIVKINVIDADRDSPGPEQTAITADAVGLALLVVLDTLAPAERLAFVLHDVFGVPFDEIAVLIEKSSENARQLASRARRRIRAESPQPDRDVARQREVVQAFFAAGRDGNFEQLITLLHPEVVHRADFGQGLRVTRGAAEVAGQAWLARDSGRVPFAATVNGGAGAVILLEGAPVAVMAFSVEDGRVRAIDILGGPARLADLGFTRMPAGALPL